LIRLLTGTFARVWLARLAKPRPEECHKVFALKVLKKIDGMRQQASALTEHLN
jgi:hypothetical protein